MLVKMLGLNKVRITFGLFELSLNIIPYGDNVLALFAIRLQRILSKIEEANTTAFIISYEEVSMSTVPCRY